jgi:hypothetical protein
MFQITPIGKANRTDLGRIMECIETFEMSELLKAMQVGMVCRVWDVIGSDVKE